ncbi:MAG: hypothetical protein JSS49_11345 [Planctomycetes bacterium]|nr:hypothetical protein [Planctomycetota bacterium]
MTDHDEMEPTPIERLVADVLQKPLPTDVDMRLRDRLMEIHGWFEPVPETASRGPWGRLAVITIVLVAVVALVVLPWVWPNRADRVADRSPPATVPVTPHVELPPSPIEPTPDPAPQAPIEAEDGYGSLVGQIVFQGPAPATTLISTTDGSTIPDESLVVDPQTGGIANVFVYLVQPRSIHPSLEAIPGPVSFHESCGQFVPHVLCFRANQTLLARSLDPFTGNVHTLSLKNAQLNFLISGKPIPVVMTVPEKVPFKVTDDIHVWMSAYWLVLDHPYATVTQKDGRFAIHQLPEGDCEFHIWHERAGFLAKRRVATIQSRATNDLGTIEVRSTSLK